MKKEEELSRMITRIFIIILFSILMFMMLMSCRVNKETVRTVTKYDTVTIVEKDIDTFYKEVEVNKKPPMVVDVSFNPCDSLGNVKPTNIVIGNGGNKVVVKKDSLGLLSVQAKCDGAIDSIVKVYESKLAEKNKEVISKENIQETNNKTIYKPNRGMWISLLINVILLIALFTRIKKIFPSII